MSSNVHNARDGRVVNISAFSHWAMLLRYASRTKGYVFDCPMIVVTPRRSRTPHILVLPADELIETSTCERGMSTRERETSKNIVRKQMIGHA